MFKRVKNYILFFIAASTPFFTSFLSGPLKTINFDYVAPFLTVLVLLYVIIFNKDLKFFKATSLTITVVLFFLAQFISGIFSDNIELAQKSLLLDFQFLLIYLTINFLLTETEAYEMIMKGLLLGFGIAVVIAIFQYLGFSGFQIIEDKGLNQNAGQISEHKSQLTRIWGPVGNSLTFSEYLAITGVTLYTYYRFLKKMPVISLVLFIVTIMAIILTVGRNAMFSTLFSVVILEIVYAKVNASKTTLVFLGLGFLAIIGLLLLLPGIQDNGNPLINRFSNASQDLKEGRLNLWIKGFDAFLKHPFLGTGPGNLFSALSAEGFPMTSKVIKQFNGQHVENYFLTILYTFGIIGAFLCLRLYFLLIKYSYKIFIHFRKRINIDAFGGVMFGAVITITLNDITNPALIFDQRIMLLFALIIAIINNNYRTLDSVGLFEKGSLLSSILKPKST